MILSDNVRQGCSCSACLFVESFIRLSFKPWFVQWVYFFLFSLFCFFKEAHTLCVLFVRKCEPPQTPYARIDASVIIFRSWLSHDLFYCKIGNPAEKKKKRHRKGEKKRKGEKQREREERVLKNLKKSQRERQRVREKKSLR